MLEILKLLWRRMLIGSAVCIVISACAGQPQTEQSTEVVAETTNTPIPTAISTATEPVQIQQLVILLADPNIDLELITEVEAILEGYSGEVGMAFENRASLEISDLPDNLRLVVALDPISNIQDLAAAAPQIQFLGMGIAGLIPGGNITVIGGYGLGIEYQAFIAGYTAAVITSDWRVAVISTSDSTKGLQARQSFMVGARYFCGLCLQVYPPFYEYPLFAELPASASQEEWRNAAASLLERSVETIYVAPGAGDSTLLDYLAQSGISIIGSSSPPDNLQQNWVATIQPDYASLLQDILPNLLGEQAGNDLPVAFLQNVNPQLLSVGRVEHIELIIEDLLAGFISPYEP